jgi:hypothetical protein
MNCSMCNEFVSNFSNIRDLNNNEFKVCGDCWAEWAKDEYEWAMMSDEAISRGFIDAHEMDVFDQLVYVSQFVVDYEANRKKQDYEFWLYCNRPVGQPIKFAIMPIA